MPLQGLCLGHCRANSCHGTACFRKAHGPWSVRSGRHIPLVLSSSAPTQHPIDAPLKTPTECSVIHCCGSSIAPGGLSGWDQPFTEHRVPEPSRSHCREVGPNPQLTAALHPPLQSSLMSGSNTGLEVRKSPHPTAHPPAGWRAVRAQGKALDPITMLISSNSQQEPSSILLMKL